MRLMPKTKAEERPGSKLTPSIVKSDDYLNENENKIKILESTSPNSMGRATRNDPKEMP